MGSEIGEITRLLHEAHAGRREALDRVMEIVYADLRRVARRQLENRYGRDLTGVSLEPAALVHEGFLRLIKQRKRYDNRGHFFAIATQAMLRVLLDHHRRKTRLRRGGDRIRVSLSGVARTVGGDPSADIPAFVEALSRLEKLDPRTAEVAKLRLVWGLEIREIAQATDLSVRTVEREWRFARRWLSTELSAGPASG